MWRSVEHRETDLYYIKAAHLQGNSVLLEKASRLRLQVRVIVMCDIKWYLSVQKLAFIKKSKKLVNPKTLHH